MNLGTVCTWLGHDINFLGLITAVHVTSVICHVLNVEWSNIAAHNLVIL